MLMFWRNGKLPDSIENMASNILDSFQQYEGANIHSSYPQCPDQGMQSDEEYRQTLEIFFSKVSIEDRFNQIQRIYSLESKEYNVIFKVYGFEENTSEFSIGSVTVYDPRNVKRIKKPIVLDISGVENVENNELCVSVKVKGVDSSSMKLFARKKAERALGIIRREKGKKALTLSNAYTICDSDGNEVGAGSEGYKSGLFHYSNLTEFMAEEYKRLGIWIDNESVNPTVKVWLASMDWYRKAIESEQSTEMLLNAWFSVEHLFQGENKISLRIPDFLRHRPNENNVHALWYPEDRIANIQLLLSFVEIKHEIRNYADKIAVEYLPDSQMFFIMKYGKKYLLPKEILSKFVENNGLTYSGEEFVELTDKIMSDLKKDHLDEPFRLVGELRNQFFQNKICMDTLRNETWRVKDDIYNIYRIRNMLVHRATTNSLLVEYYAARALEYSFSLLTELKWQLLRTKDDSEIKDINDYFQKLVLDTNIALESVQNDEMSKFRKWVFS